MVGVFDYLMTSYQYVGTIGGGCSKQIGVAALTQLEPFAQFGHGSREIAHSEVGLLHVGKQLA